MNPASRGRRDKEEGELPQPLRQAWERPSQPRPIVIIGGGAIVRTAHLPAYQRLHFPIAGLFDVRLDTALRLAADAGVSNVYRTLTDACHAGTDGDVVFDVAVPGDQVLGVLRCLPEGAAVLVQKPMGEDLAMAREIREMCEERRLTAAMNFQLRFSPNMLALQDLLGRGELGDVVDIEVRLQVRQPWEIWPFMRGLPRLEVLYHSIHYLDMIRLIAGEPRGVYCRAVGHPALPEYSDPRSSIIVDYGDGLRCSLTLNHTHVFGPRHRTSMFKVEGTEGAALLSMGVNLDYPLGLPDTLDVARDGDWHSVPLRGSWFTEAFEGPMSNLQRFVAGEDPALVSPIADAIRTMAVVEACYESSAAGGTPIPEP
jgi:predicted dehydrogenase